MRGGRVVVVQKAFKFEPSAEAVAFWLDYLRELRVNHRLEPGSPLGAIIRPVGALLLEPNDESAVECPRSN